MYRHLTLAITALIAIGGPISAQTYQRRASLGTNQVAGQGKCTVEIVVDGVADVTIRGDSGTLRAVSGQQPQWRRFECTGVMPANPVDFQFHGVDGRGRQQLIQDPRNGGTAIVRIEDPQGGAEGYTFDLTWSGGAGYNNNSGSIFNPQYGNGQYNYQAALRACQDGVRQRFNNSNITFENSNVTDNPGNRDRVDGTFRGQRGDQHSFSCAMNTNTGQLLSVRIDNQNDNQYGGGAINGQYNYQQALRACQDGVRQRFNNSNIRFETSNVTDNPGSRDRVDGSFRGSRGDQHTYSCAMNTNTGQLLSVRIDNQNDNGRGRDGQVYGDNRNRAMSDADALRVCQQSVIERIRNQGSPGAVRFTNTVVRDGRVNGTAQANRDAFSYSCAMDLYRGTVQSVDVSRR